MCVCVRACMLNLCIPDICPNFSITLCVCVFRVAVEDGTGEAQVWFLTETVANLLLLGKPEWEGLQRLVRVKGHVRIYTRGRNMVSGTCFIIHTHTLPLTECSVPKVLLYCNVKMYDNDQNPALTHSLELQTERERETYLVRVCVCV